MEANDPSLWMMGSCLCTIVALDDGHEALRHLVEMSNRFPGCRFHIWEPLEALLECIAHDRLFLHQKWRLVTLSWNTQQTKPSLSEKIFIFALRHPFYQLRLGWLPIYDHFGSCRSHLCRTVSRPRTESSSWPLFENVFVPSSKIFFFSLYVRRLVVVRLFSYTVEEAGHSSISDEH